MRSPVRLWALLAVFVVGACATAGSLDARMKPMVGADEAALVAAMGRAPDTSVQASPDTRLLQWRWQKAYAIPDRMLGYTYAGGAYKPIPHTGEGTVRDACLAEWTIENGVATRCRFEGNDCSAATTQLAVP